MVPYFLFWNGKQGKKNNNSNKQQTTWRWFEFSIKNNNAKWKISKLVVKNKGGGERA